MERQDAIYWITNLIGRYGKEYDEALEIAESTLRQQSELIEDAVSRQRVIDTIMDEPSETYYPCYFAEMIRELPATYPKVIRCKNCKFSHMTNDGRYCKYCDMFTDDYGQLIEMYFESNFYCGYAERKINERTG